MKAQLMLPALIFALTSISLAIPATAEDSAQVVAPSECILDVYGAITPPRLKTPQTSLILLYEGPMREMLDPESISYEYNPVVRAQNLSDDELQSLFYPKMILKIIHHSDLYNIEQARHMNFITPRPDNICQAELIISDISGIWKNSQGHSIEESMIGSSRMTAGFLFRRSTTNGSKAIVISSRVSGRWPPFQMLQGNFSFYRSAMKVATSAAFAEFLADILSKSKN